MTQETFQGLALAMLAINLGLMFIVLGYVSGIAQRTRWTDTTVDATRDFIRDRLEDDLEHIKGRLNQIVKTNQERDAMLRAVAGIKVDVK